MVQLVGGVNLHFDCCTLGGPSSLYYGHGAMICWRPVWNGSPFKLALLWDYMELQSDGNMDQAIALIEGKLQLFCLTMQAIG